MVLADRFMTDASPNQTAGSCASRSQRTFIRRTNTVLKVIDKKPAFLFENSPDTFVLGIDLRIQGFVINLFPVITAPQMDRACCQVGKRPAFA